MNVVLTIAGSDSGGGAGIQADLKTMEAHGVFGASVLTAVTAQNTRGVSRVHNVPGTVIQAQLKAVFSDFNVAAVKIGMLSNATIIRAVAAGLRKYATDIPVVLDPVMVATSGDRLLDESATELMISQLFPLATLITPNVAESEVLAGMEVDSLEDSRTAAERIAALSPESFILIKGAHLRVSTTSGKQMAQDLLFKRGEEHVFSESFIDTGPLHGTGCTLSSAIASNLARGMEMREAIKRAKTYVTDAILLAPKDLGGGSQPLRHSMTGLQ